MFLIRSPARNRFIIVNYLSLCKMYDIQQNLLRYAVVRDGQTGHPELLGPVEQVLDGRVTVQDGILGMYVQVDERHSAIDVG